MNQKLKEIQGKRGPSFQTSYDKRIQSQFYLKKKNQEKRLDEENAKILNNILEISKRKKHFWMNNSDKYWSFPVSLNINTRKVKSEEIYKENKKIAETLARCKGSSEYSVSRLTLEAQNHSKFKNMITKQSKLKQIKKSMEAVGSASNPSNFLRMQDIVSDSLARLKGASLKDLKAESETNDLSSAQVARYLRTAVGLNTKVLDYLIEVFEKASLFGANGVSPERLLETLDKSQYVLELVNM